MCKGPGARSCKEILSLRVIALMGQRAGQQEWYSRKGQQGLYRSCAVSTEGPVTFNLSYQTLVGEWRPCGGVEAISEQNVMWQ